MSVGNLEIDYIGASRHLAALPGVHLSIMPLIRQGRTACATGLQLDSGREGQWCQRPKPLAARGYARLSHCGRSYQVINQSVRAGARNSRDRHAVTIVVESALGQS